MKPLIILAVIASAALPTHAAAQSSSCGMAVLQDVEVLTTLVPQASVTTARNRRAKPGVQDRFAYSTPVARLSKRYLVTVRLNDMVYTGEGSGDGFWTYDPSALVVNDAIHACVVKNRLRLTRPDGKDYSINIVRAIRDPLALTETASR